MDSSISFHRYDDFVVARRYTFEGRFSTVLRRGEAQAPFSKTAVPPPLAPLFDVKWHDPSSSTHVSLFTLVMQ